MHKYLFTDLLVVLAVALCTLFPFASMPAAAAEDTEDKGHVVVLEFGATGEREISERTSHLGPSVGIEIEPIENCLEIEFGASPYRNQGATNWDLDLPFKKPFRLTSEIEVMPGLGPTWAHTTQPGVRSSTWGAEAVIDFFFWRSKRFGWYFEPSFGMTFGNGDKKSVALAAGVFFAVP